MEQSQVGNAEEVYSDVEFVWMGHSHPLSVLLVSWGWECLLLQYRWWL